MKKVLLMTLTFCLGSAFATCDLNFVKGEEANFGQTIKRKYLNTLHKNTEFGSYSLQATVTTLYGESFYQSSVSGVQVVGYWSQGMVMETDKETLDERLTREKKERFAKLKAEATLAKQQCDKLTLE